MSIKIAGFNVLNAGINPFEFYPKNFHENKAFMTVLKATQNSYSNIHNSSIKSDFKNLFSFNGLIEKTTTSSHNVTITKRHVVYSKILEKAISLISLICKCIIKPFQMLSNLWTRYKEPSFQEVLDQNKINQMISLLNINNSTQKLVNDFIQQISNQNYYQLASQFFHTQFPSIDRLLREGVALKKIPEWEGITTTKQLTGTSFDELFSHLIQSFKSEDQKIIKYLEEKLQEKIPELLKKIDFSKCKNFEAILKSQDPKAFIFLYLALFPTKLLYSISRYSGAISSCNTFKTEFTSTALGDAALATQVFLTHIKREKPEFLGFQEPTPGLLKALKNTYHMKTNDGKEDTYVLVKKDSNFELSSHKIKVNPRARMSVILCHNKNNKNEHYLFASMHAKTKTGQPASAKNQVAELKKIEKELNTEGIFPTIIFEQDANTVPNHKKNCLTPKEYKEYLKAHNFLIVSSSQESVLKKRLYDLQAQYNKGNRVDFVTKDFIAIKPSKTMHLKNSSSLSFPRFNHWKISIFLKLPSIISQVFNLSPPYLPNKAWPTDHTFIQAIANLEKKSVS